MKAVQYMKALDGSLVAVQPDVPQQGYEYAGRVYSTKEQANYARGIATARSYQEAQEQSAQEALERLLWLNDPAWGDWDKQEQHRDAQREIARDLIASIFPGHKKRDQAADDLLAALANAEANYRENCQHLGGGFND